MSRISLPFRIALFTLAGMIVVYFGFGFYYETNDEMQMELFFRGISVPEGSWDLYFWHRFSGWLFSLLYGFVPGFPWYGVLMYGLLYLALVNFFIGIHHLVSGKAAFFLSVFIFFFVFLENLLLLNFLRVTLIVTSSVVFILFVVFPRLSDSKKFWLWFFYTFMLFLAGYQIRPEGGMLLAGISSIFLFFQYSLSRSVRKSIHYLMVFFIVSFVIIFLFDRLNRDNNYVQDNRIIPYIQYLHNIDNPAGNITGTDSLRLQIAVSGFFCDEYLVNEEFLSRHTPPYSLFLMNNLRIAEWPGQIRSVLIVFLRNNTPLAALTIILMFTLIISTYRQKDYRFLISVLLANGLFWIALVALASTYKMPNRLLTPMLIAQLFFNAMFLIPLKEKGYPYPLTPKWYAGIILILLLTAGLYSYRQFKKNIWYRQRCRINTETLASLEKLLPDTKVLFTKEAISLFNGLDPLKSSPLIRKDTYIIWGWVNWYSPFKKHLENLTGSRRFSEAMIVGLSRKPHLILASQKDARLLTAHLKFYNPEIQIQPVAFIDVEEKTYNQKISSYHLVINGND